MGHVESGIEVMTAEVSDGPAGAATAGCARAAVGADGLVAREHAVAYVERGGASANKGKSDGVDHGTAATIAGVAARAAQAANGLVTNEGAMGESEGSAETATGGGKQAAAVAVPAAAAVPADSADCMVIDE